MSLPQIHYHFTLYPHLPLRCYPLSLSLAPYSWLREYSERGEREGAWALQVRERVFPSSVEAFISQPLNPAFDMGHVLGVNLMDFNSLHLLYGLTLNLSSLKLLKCSLTDVCNHTE